MLKRNNLLCLVAVLACLALSAPSIYAESYTMYVSDWGQVATNTSGSILYGHASGAVMGEFSLIGTIKSSQDNYHVYDIGMVGGNLYGVGTNSTGRYYLFNINKTSGAITNKITDLWENAFYINGTTYYNFTDFTSLSDNAQYSVAHRIDKKYLMNLSSNTAVELGNITYGTGTYAGTYKVAGVGDLTIGKNGLLYAAVDLGYYSGNGGALSGWDKKEYLITINPTTGQLNWVSTDPNTNFLLTHDFNNNTVGLIYTGSTLYGFTDSRKQYEINADGKGLTPTTDVTGISTLGGNHTLTGAAVPLPPSVWLFGSGLVGLLGLRRFNKIN